VSTVPRQRTSESAEDPFRIADRAALDGLLRCWVRETGTPVPAEGGVLELPLRASRTYLRADVRYRSQVGHHRFDEVRLGNGAPATAVAVVALLAAEFDEVAPEAATELVGSVADSVARVARHVRCRSAAPAEPPGTTPFLAAEQGLILGHPLHPTPKSRIGWTSADAQLYSPELRGSFPLHWFAADASIVAQGGKGRELLEPLAPPVPAGTVPIPAHPWQAGEVQARPRVRRLLDEGLLHDLGDSGQPWSATSSLRTVYHPESPVMLKFSLGLPITNSKRENLRKELYRGVEIDRLLTAGLAKELAAAHPGFRIVCDPGWLGVQDQDGSAGIGLDVVVRDNPFGQDERVACVAGLAAERPERGRSVLAEIVTELAAGGETGTVAEQWCARYFDAVLAPILWLYRNYGLGLEAHQQNTLVCLDSCGWPCGGWYRDNQGYYLSQRRIGALERFLPTVGLVGESRCDEELIDERLGYYVGINNMLGLVGAFGSQGLADERRLLTVLERGLGEFADLPMVHTLMRSPSLRCKGNLLTRLHGLDELVGPLWAQSVYCDIANPFVSRS
jgi:siderophore synthetase component